MMKIKLLMLWWCIISTLKSKRFWLQFLFIFTCMVLNIIAFEYLFKDVSKSLVWLAGWFQCTVYYAVFGWD